MRKTIVILTAIVIWALSSTLAEGMPTISWERAATLAPVGSPTLTPSPTPAPYTPTPAPDTISVDWPKVDWSANSQEVYFLILFSGEINGDSVKDLMLWLNDTYSIPSVTYLMDTQEAGQHIPELLDEDGKIVAILIYGFHRTEFDDAIRVCEEHSIPVWVSEKMELNDMIGELDSAFGDTYIRMS